MFCQFQRDVLLLKKRLSRFLPVYQEINCFLPGSREEIDVVDIYFNSREIFRSHLELENMCKVRNKDSARKSFDFPLASLFFNI